MRRFGGAESSSGRGFPARDLHDGQTPDRIVAPHLGHIEFVCWPMKLRTKLDPCFLLIPLTAKS
ncbi:hypothetical protein B7486_09360 [cyanobacterium TDX16]|nr:hypothetical protein B7486_09360 [cyanobacterium TDX16]